MFKHYISVLPATALASMALASPAAASGAACQGDLDIRYGDPMSGAVGAGQVEGLGTWRCAGSLAGSYAMGEQGGFAIGEPASWTGTCAAGELSLPFTAHQETVFGSARVDGTLAVVRTVGGWDVTGTGTVSRTGFFGSQSSERVAITGAGAAAPVEPCARETVELTLSVAPHDEAGEPVAEEVAAIACAQAQRGTAGPDRLVGTAEGDVLDARGGDDRASGLAGDDCLIGGGGRDVLLGGAGNDQIDSADGRRDRVRCGAGTDEALVDRRDRLAGCESAYRDQA